MVFLIRLFPKKDAYDKKNESINTCFSAANGKFRCRKF